jgi:exosortase
MSQISDKTLPPEIGTKPSLAGLLPALLLLALLVGLYGITAPVLPELFRQLWVDPNNSHGLLVIPVSLFLVWRRRKALAKLDRRACQPALLIIIFGLALLPLALAAEVAFLSQLSLLIVIGGLILHIRGKAVFRQLLFPYLFLFFAIPWPSLLVETLTFPLQLIAAKSATLLIGLLGIPVVRDGVGIAMAGYTFAVEAPCSGLHYLSALMALGALTAYCLQGGFFRRAGLLIIVPALAMIGNSLRIVTILLIARTWGPKSAEGFYHGFSGLTVFLLTFLLLLLMGRLFGLGKMREDL